MSATLPSLESLRVFAACARRLNFTRAASDLCVTPSAVSLRVGRLEDVLGVKLFVRRGPCIEITPEGARLAAAVDEAMATIESGLDRCRRGPRALRVTCAPTFATRWLMPRLDVYRGLRDAESISIDTTDAVVAANRFDIAIRSAVEVPSGFAAVALLADEGTPMLSPALVDVGTPLTPRALCRMPLLPDPRWGRWFELAGVVGAEPTIASTRFATYELEAVAAAQGAGVALLSRFFYGEFVDTGALIAPFDCVVSGPNRYWALWREELPKPHFVRWLEKAFAACGDQNP